MSSSHNEIQYQPEGYAPNSLNLFFGAKTSRVGITGWKSIPPGIQ